MAPGGSRRCDLGNIRQYQPHRSVYAPRISNERWELYRSVLMQLHHAGVSRARMLAILESEHDFRPSEAQLNTRMRAWELFPRTTGTIDDPFEPETAYRDRSDLVPIIEHVGGAFDLLEPPVGKDHRDLELDLQLLFREAGVLERGTNIEQQGDVNWGGSTVEELYHAFNEILSTDTMHQICLVHDVASILLYASWGISRSQTLYGRIELDWTTSHMETMFLYWAYEFMLRARCCEGFIMPKWILQRININIDSLLKKGRIDCFRLFWPEPCKEFFVGDLDMRTDQWISYLHSVVADLSESFSSFSPNSQPPMVLLKEGVSLDEAYSADFWQYTSFAAMVDILGAPMCKLLTWVAGQTEVFVEQCSVVAAPQRFCPRYFTDELEMHMTNYLLNQWIEYTMNTRGFMAGHSRDCFTEGPSKVVSDLAIFRFTVQTIMIFCRLLRKKTARPIKALIKDWSSHGSCGCFRSRLSLILSIATRELKDAYSVDGLLASCEGYRPAADQYTTSHYNHPDALTLEINVAKECYRLRRSPDERRHRDAYARLPLRSSQHGAHENKSEADTMLCDEEDTSSLRSFGHSGAKLKDLYGTSSSKGTDSVFSMSIGPSVASDELISRLFHASK